MASGARRKVACELLGLTARTLERWGDEDDDGRHGPNTVPANKLPETERRQIIALATSPEFRDQSPKQIVPRLADQGRLLRGTPDDGIRGGLDDGHRGGAGVKRRFRPSLVARIADRSQARQCRRQKGMPSSLALSG